VLAFNQNLIFQSKARIVNGWLVQNGGIILFSLNLLCDRIKCVRKLVWSYTATDFYSQRFSSAPNAWTQQETLRRFKDQKGSKVDTASRNKEIALFEKRRRFGYFGQDRYLYVAHELVDATPMKFADTPKTRVNCPSIF
jgi:hypothetical protein